MTSNANESTVIAGQHRREGEYWSDRLSGGLVRSVFPHDGVASGKTGTVDSPCPDIHFPLLMGLRNGSDVRLHMILTAVLSALLARYSGNSDIIVGCPVLRQDDGDAGDFINTVLTLRNGVYGGMTFKELLLGVRRTLTEAAANQNYPLDVLLRKLGLPVPGDGGPFPLFGTALLLENLHSAEYLDNLTPDLLFCFGRGDDGLTLSLRYDTGLYRRETVERIGRHYWGLLGAVLKNVDIPLAAVDFMDPGEKGEMLSRLNRTGVPYPAGQTIYGLFRGRAASGPDRAALSGPGGDGPGGDGLLTYGLLSQRVAQTADRLRRKGVGRGTPVGVLCDRSKEMIIALLGILGAGGAYVPTDPEYPAERIRYMLEDAGINLLVKDGSGVPAGLPAGLETLDLPVPPAAEGAPHPPDPAKGFDRGGNDPAYVIYTSGTTGNPKGTVIEHRNVVRLLFNDEFAFDFSHRDTWTLFHSYCFDFSVWEMYGALLYGGRLVIVPRMVARDAGVFADLLERKCVTVLNQTPSAFYGLQTVICDGPVRPLGPRYVIFGGEALGVGRLKPWAARYPGTRLINMYGITETTVHVTFKALSADDLEAGVGNIGVPIPTLAIRLVDRDGNPVPPGVAGECLVSGDGVARGYLNRPDLTAERFIKIPSHQPHRSHQSYRTYKSGDLARYVDGDLEYLGRIDQQVKVRGHRIELGEIEAALTALQGVAQAVVVKRDRGNDGVLCAYVTGDDGVDDGVDLRRQLAGVLPDYMVPSVVVPVERIPLTVNGKVDVNALPDPADLEAAQSVTPPRNDLEKTFVDVWAGVLGVDRDRIGIDTDFFGLGGHSLKATLAMARLRELTGADLPLSAIFETPTIRGLAARCGDRDATTAGPVIAPVEDKEYYPLSPAQKRIYVLQGMKPGSTVYNVPQVLELRGNLTPETPEADRERIGRIFCRLAARHESLRTSFFMLGEEAVQRVHHRAEPVVEYVAPTGEFDMDAVVKTFIRPFDLTRAPLLRVGLRDIPGAPGAPGAPGEGQRCLLLLDMHHIVTDGISMGILAREFLTLYNGGDPEMPRLRYRDYAAWWNSGGPGGALEKQEAYWRRCFGGDLPVLQLPTDFPRPRVWDFKGGRLHFRLDGDVTDGLRRLASESGATLFMVMLAVYTVLLSKLTGQEEMVTGTPSGARGAPALDGVVGMFVNTLALRCAPVGEKVFIDYLDEIKTVALGAFENRDYPFEDLVETISLPRDTGRNPLFDVIFALLNVDIPETDTPGLSLKPLHYSDGVSRVDLSFQCRERDSGVDIDVEYGGSLFRPATVERFTGYFKRLAACAAADPRQRLSDLEIMDIEEKKRVLCRLSCKPMKPVTDAGVHELFLGRARQIPDHAAVSGRLLTGSPGRWGTLTYRGLASRGANLARSLVEKGFAPGDIAAVKLENGVERVTALLGILMAGGAYLPVDPTWPEGRIARMMADSGAGIVVTPVSLEDGGGEDTVTGPVAPRANAAGMAAYVLYTSGSTGVPRGVVVEHGNVTDLVESCASIVPLEPGKRLLATGNYVFDISTFEIWGSLTRGGHLYIGDGGAVVNGTRFMGLLHRHCIDILHLVPQLFKQLLLSPPGAAVLSSPGCFLVGGDMVNPADVAFLRGACGNLDILHMYGPTETTVFATYLRVDRDYDTALPIGRAVPGGGVCVLDRRGYPVAPGVAGELVVRGGGVTRGYLNRPELTAEKFTPPGCLSRKYYRAGYKTGDLVRRLDDGNLEFLGRRDSQIKIRGLRIETGEIGARLERHPDINQAVVVPTGNADGETSLCAYIISGGRPDPAELHKYLAAELPEYMIPNCFTQLGALPLTAGGKVDRRALAESADTGCGAEYGRAARDETERKLLELWREVLGETAGLDDHFFECGGNSLKALILVSRIHEVFDVQLLLTDVFEYPTAAGQAQRIASCAETTHSAIAPVEKREYYELSSAQKRLYIYQQLNLASVGYNMPWAVYLEGDIDGDRLEKSFCRLLERHESLRTSFCSVKDEPVQRVCGGVVPDITDYGSIEPGGEHNVVESFVRPFDLGTAPLLRVGLVTLSDGRRLLLTDMHHIICDGTSRMVLLEDFLRLYGGETPEPLRIQYKDFSCRQNALFAEGGIKDQEKYWLDVYGGERGVPELQLPTDFPRPDRVTFEAGRCLFFLDETMTGQLNQLCLETGTTLYMVLLAILNILLHKYTGQGDIVVGTGIVGRNHADLRRIIGMFINMLAVRNFPSGEKTFVEFLGEVRQHSIDAFDHQDMQLEVLVERLKLKRHPSRRPLFDVTFTVNNFEGGLPADGAAGGGGIRLLPYEYDKHSVAFDLVVDAAETGGRVQLSFKYKRSLFKEETIERMGRRFVQVLEQVLANREIKTADIQLDHQLLKAGADILEEDEDDFDF